MAIYVYHLSNGTLYSWCPNDTDQVATAAQLLAAGLGMVSGLPALSPTVAWNPATKTTTSVVPATAVPPAPVAGTLVFNGVSYTVSGTTV